MRTIMAKNPQGQRRAFYAWLANTETRGTVLEPDFDNDNNAYPATAEHLDWHQCRHWPALARN